ncbi:hypothetical protein AC249_AIPGENE6430 [Exaiptasia diaphana]|nr:hypothetical protein AC249_AIPGENE6437 [Exaiptasia diaphana]KXJ26027.1 hypothetical protein AC249_AIPGENE6430 [Exaiptasia diaphana]
MWGRLTSVAQAVTDKLEESFGEDHEYPTAGGAAGTSTQPQSQEEVISDLRKALVESEKRNEDINHEFQKLLRAKEASV